MLWHRVNLGVELFLNFDYILLVFLSDQVDCKANLPITPTSTDSVQIGCRFSWEVKVNDHIYCLHVNSSRYQVWTHKGFELTFPESLKYFDSLIAFHIGVEILVLIFAFIEFPGKEFCSLIASAKYDTLINDKGWVYFVYGPYFLFLVDQHVIVSQS